MNRVNTPWDNWNDFGGKYDHNFWDNEFLKIRQAGWNAYKERAIALQDHRVKVWHRNIRIKRL